MAEEGVLPPPPVVQLVGTDIGQAMQKVVEGSITIDIGPSHIADGFSVLTSRSTIRLNGTMGLADFDLDVGVRRGTGSVYCVLREDDDVTFAYDVLRYDPSSDELVGDLPCFEGF